MKKAIAVTITVAVITLLAAVYLAIASSVIWLTAKFVVTPAFGTNPLTFLQAFAISVVLTVIGGYFKNQGNNNGK